MLCWCWCWARPWIAGGLGAERRPGVPWLTNEKPCAGQSPGRITIDVAVIHALLRNTELIYTPFGRFLLILYVFANAFVA